MLPLFLSPHREEDKNIFDYCRENNIEHITTAISSKEVDVNAKDEEVSGILSSKSPLVKQNMLLIPTVKPAHLQYGTIFPRNSIVFGLKLTISPWELFTLIYLRSKGEA